jgi:hypothetical protein
MRFGVQILSVFFVAAAVSAGEAGAERIPHVDRDLPLAALLTDLSPELMEVGSALEAVSDVVLTTEWFDAPIAFTALGSHWVLSGEGEFGLEIQVDSRPSDWYPIALDLHGDVLPTLPSGEENPVYGDEIGELLLLGAQPAAAWRLRLSFFPGDLPLRLEGLSLVFIDAESVSHERETPRLDAYPKPPVYSRAAWGADPPQCSSGYCSVTHLGTHHTASPGAYDSAGFADCAANVRGIQDYHEYTLGWCDIGYNYLVCKHGKVWEGRAGGDDVRGAHDGYNCGSMGVAALGYFHPPYNDMPTAQMLDAYEELYAWKADQKGIDPFGHDYYVGYGGTMDNLYGHRDVKLTACPGDLLYAQLPAIRAGVDERLGGGGEWIFDNPTANLRGAWSTGNSAPGHYGSNYYFASTTPGGANLCYWSQQINQAGSYALYAWWAQGSNRSTQTEFGIKIGGTLHTKRVNQQQNGGRWNLIGTYWMPLGRVLFGLSNDAPTGAVVIGDAMKLVRQ